MGNVRGLRARLCQKCREVTPHRTLYAKTESGGRMKWLRLFWVCVKCHSLNHVVVPTYRLERASSYLPSVLTIAVVDALQNGSLDVEDLLARLRGRRVPELRHVFNSEVMMALEYLKGRGVVDEETCDRTERTIESI